METHRKKLIEVALPLEAINATAVHEKDIHTGHPANLHAWFARRPLAACRAVLFASLVDDPSAYIEDDKKATEERRRLFDILERLIRWESNNDAGIIREAKLEIARSLARSAKKSLPVNPTDDDLNRMLAQNAPSVSDPFCGGGVIPLEAQRLGLRTYASDLNPIAVLITKALVEIPTGLVGHPPVNPNAKGKLDSGSWTGHHGLIEDILYYSEWMREQARQRIGSLYPSVKLPNKNGGGEGVVIAWLWVRTVRCPNPACGAQMPLVSTLRLSTKVGEEAWLAPLVDTKAKTITFEVRTGSGNPTESPKIGRGSNFRCLICKQVADDSHIKQEGLGRKMGLQLIAMAVESRGRRFYVPADIDQVRIASGAAPKWTPEEELPYEPRAIWCTLYGLKNYRDLFTLRQLTAITTLVDLLKEVSPRIRLDAEEASTRGRSRVEESDRVSPAAYADAIVTYLAFAIDRVAQTNCSLVRWLVRRTGPSKGTPALDKQALPMVWDFSEGNLFGDSVGAWSSAVNNVLTAFKALPLTGQAGVVSQLDATSNLNGPGGVLVCTDPPYYANIGYADLSDFFYVWLRRSISHIYPDVFSTVLTPKAQELVASPSRFGGDRDKAKEHFVTGLAEAFSSIREKADPRYPVTVFYAYRESDQSVDEGAPDERLTASTGWETMLDALIRAGFSVIGTWPMRTEQSHRTVALGANALASSIVLVCSNRVSDAPLATRREFTSALRKELPDALRRLQEGSIAPVDLAQAAIGPGMAVFSRFGKVLEPNGSSMTIRTALQIINQELEAHLRSVEVESDPETQLCVAWFEQYGMESGPFGQAEVLEKAKNASLDHLARGGVLTSKGGKVSLVPRTDYPADWDPRMDARVSMWECTQHLIKRHQETGESAAAALVVQLGPGQSEGAKILAYRLYGICQSKGWAGEALAYNEFVVAWPEILEKAASTTGEGPQKTLQVEEKE